MPPLVDERRRSDGNPSAHAKMKTQALMSLSAVLMAALGLCASFLPQEILSYFGADPRGLGVLLIQVVGALYLGFAMLNWMARANLIGGVYSRPVAMGNFLHFAVVAVTLLKALLGGMRSEVVLIGGLVYSVFAVWFGLVVFTHPKKQA
jgi:predicted membrane channel-forming protein YqfA (hemolysin III family)